MCDDILENELQDNELQSYLSLSVNKLNQFVNAKDLTQKFKTIINKKNVVLTHSLKESLFLLLYVLRQTHLKKCPPQDFNIAYNKTVLHHLNDFLSEYCHENDIDCFYSIISGHTINDKIEFEENFSAIKNPCARICYSNYNGLLAIPYRDDNRFDYNIIITDYNSINDLKNFNNPDNKEFYIGTLNYRHGGSLGLGYIILPEDFEFPFYLYPTDLSRLADKYLTKYKYNDKENNLTQIASSLLGALSMHARLLCWSNNYITFIVDEKYGSKINIARTEFNVNIDGEDKHCWTINIPSNKLLNSVISQFNYIEPLPNIIKNNESLTGIKPDSKTIHSIIDR